MSKQSAAISTALALAAARRKASGGGKSKKGKGKGKSKKGLPPWVRTGAEILVGTLLGGILAPVLPAALSGPALGIALVGVGSRGFRRGAMPHVGVALAAQGAHMIARTKTYTAIQVGVSAGLVSVGMTPNPGLMPGTLQVSGPARQGGGDAITRVSAALGDAARVAGAVSNIADAFGEVNV